MFELRVDRKLHVTHALLLYDGIREPMHEHHWMVSVCVTSEVLDQIGAVMDFNKLARIIDDTCAPLQDKCLNEVSPFDDVNPSSENVVDHIFKGISPRLPKGVVLDRVTITRTEIIEAQFTKRRA